MKISQLFFTEAKTISFDPHQKTVISTPVIQFIKENDIKQEDIDKAFNDAQKTKEFKKLISFGYTLNSSAIQKKRGTLNFEIDNTNNPDNEDIHPANVMCYITSQAREGKRVIGYTSRKLSLEVRNTKVSTNVMPRQLSDKEPVSVTLFENLKIALNSVIALQEGRAKKIEKTEANLQKFKEDNGFENNQHVSLFGLASVNPLKKLEDGTFYLNASKANHSNYVLFDYGGQSSFDKSLVFSKAKFNNSSVFHFALASDPSVKIKSFDFLPSLIDQFRKENFKEEVHLLITQQISFKDLAKVLKSKNLKIDNIVFGRGVKLTETPLLSFNQILKKHSKSVPFTFEAFTLEKEIDQHKVKPLNGEIKFEGFDFVSQFKQFINGDLSGIDFQNYLLDVGLENCAKM